MLADVVAAATEAIRTILFIVGEGLFFGLEVEIGVGVGVGVEVGVLVGFKVFFGVGEGVLAGVGLGVGLGLDVEVGCFPLLVPFELLASIVQAPPSGLLPKDLLMPGSELYE